VSTERLLRERVKELQCLFEISRVLRQIDAGLEPTLARVVEVIPRGFQYPERAGTRIRIGPVSRQTGGFTDSRFRLSASIGVQGDTGSVDVCYPAEMAGIDPDPFLPEEVRLLEKIAGEIALAVGSLRSAERRCGATPGRATSESWKTRCNRSCS